MSGGSWEYVYRKLEDAATILYREPEPRCRLAPLMKALADAMHDIEWVDSFDYSAGAELSAIQRVLDLLKEGGGSGTTA